VLSHLKASQSVDTVSCSPSTFRTLFCRTIECPTSCTVHIKCTTNSAVHSPPCRSIRSAPHRRLIKIQYSHRSNEVFPHAITEAISIISGRVSIFVPTWRIVL
jgi:hypothetical protein